MMAPGLAYGWYGKVPCVGDFVRQGLSPHFIGAWDTWLQELLVAGRKAEGERWRDCYLTAPIWRFALSAGTCGPRTAVGIMMPSVDRVGRQFPLCIAIEVDAPAWIAYQAVEPSFAALEEAALAMLEDDAPLSLLEGALAKIAPPLLPTQPHMTRMGTATALVGEGTPAQALAGLAAAAPATLWVAALDGVNRVLLTPQMPSGSEGARTLFDANAALWSPDAQENRE